MFVIFVHIGLWNAVGWVVLHGCVVHVGKNGEVVVGGCNCNSRCGLSCTYAEAVESMSSYS